MIRYAILNCIFIAGAWYLARRLKLIIHAQALVITLIALYVMMVIFNTYLTALPIVEYNPAYILGIYIVTWPVEDIAYLLVALFLAPGLYGAFLNYYESIHHTVTPTKTPSSRQHASPKRTRRRS